MNLSEMRPGDVKEIKIVCKELKSNDIWQCRLCDFYDDLKQECKMHDLYLPCASKPVYYRIEED